VAVVSTGVGRNHFLAFLEVHGAGGDCDGASHGEISGEVYVASLGTASEVAGGLSMLCVLPVWGQVPGLQTRCLCSIAAQSVPGSRDSSKHRISVRHKIRFFIMISLLWLWAIRTGTPARFAKRA